MPTVEQTTERARALVQRAKETWDREVRPIVRSELGFIVFFVHFFICYFIFFKFGFLYISLIHFLIGSFYL